MGLWIKIIGSILQEVRSNFSIKKKKKKGYVGVWVWSKLLQVGSSPIELGFGLSQPNQTVTPPEPELPSAMHQTQQTWISLSRFSSCSISTFCHVSPLPILYVNFWNSLVELLLIVAIFFYYYCFCTLNMLSYGFFPCWISPESWYFFLLFYTSM